MGLSRRLRDEMGSVFACDGFRQQVRLGNDDAFAVVFEEVNCRGNLGTHAAGGELALGHIFFGFGDS